MCCIHDQHLNDRTQVVDLPEEACSTAEELEYRDTTRAYGIREQFYEERYGDSVNQMLGKVNLGIALTVR